MCEIVGDCEVAQTSNYVITGCGSEFHRKDVDERVESSNLPSLTLIDPHSNRPQV